MAEKTLYEGKALSLVRLDGNIGEIKLDLQGESVNKLNKVTLDELRKAIDLVKGDSSFKGLLLTSGKPVFVVGADITEFLTLFTEEDSVLHDWLNFTHSIFNDLEDLTIPSVCAINGMTLGGGFELALACTYRIMADVAKVGLPETKLGLFPGWGGTIRLPRIVGADNALEWIAGGKQYSGKAALDCGAVDAVVASNKLREASLHLLDRAIKGSAQWKTKRQEKLEPLSLRTPVEHAMVFDGGKAFIAGQAGPNYPAPVVAAEVMQKCATLDRNQAKDLEIAGFIKVAKTPVAESLVTVFLSDQFNKKKAKGYTKAATKKIERAAVLGAGIMGGGIAYQSASKGIPIIMKDIATPALELGMGEATKLLAKQVNRGKIDNVKMGKVLASITPTLSYGDIDSADIIVEAIVENENIKKSVLAEVENTVSKGTILASNTSTISISRLAAALKRPEDFCGMHFFNPVHRMPLVEIIRGEKSSDAAIAATVAYAMQMGKTPIVVNDCPGFLVNRILFPYFAGLIGLIEEGVDYKRIDKVMEKYGWPMGPCYLLDVVGIDTSVHCNGVMAAGFPERMVFGDNNVMDILNSDGRLGQKSGSGFYIYETDKRGKPKKKVDPTVDALISKAVKSQKEVTDQEIVDRMMIPMMNEAALCLEEKIVGSPIELDLALLYGIGFPPFRCGAMKELDRMGAKGFIEKANSYLNLGKVYDPAPLIQKNAKDGKLFYPIV